MDNILGKDLMVFINGKALACATNHSLSIEANQIDVSCKDTGIYGASMPGKITWSIQADALVTVNEDGNLETSSATSLSYTALMDALMARKSVKVVFSTVGNAAATAADADGHVVPTGGWTPAADGYEGYAVITSIEANASDGDLCSYTVQFQGLGALSKHTANP